MDERILAQDPLAHPSPTDQEHECFACYEGWIYLGFEGEDEEVEEIERVPCRR